MGKLYVIGLGGTGARVLKSLTMLMSAGVKVSADQLIPILIDSDLKNGDLERTIKQLHLYQDISALLNANQLPEGSFFSNSILSLRGGFMPDAPTAIFSHTLKELLGVPYMQNVKGEEDENKALLDALFSEKELQFKCVDGFEGKAKIGSLLFQEFLNHEFKKNVCQSFEEGDKIFIIGSTFGGTGAAGIPQLIDRLRHISENDYPNASLIKNSQIGAIYVLPYFKVEQEDESPIDSFTFTSKSKSTLKYYLGSGVNNLLDYLYTIGDTAGAKMYPNCRGGAQQKNPAHFVEMIAALSIWHFSTQNLQAENWEKRMVRYLEYGLENDVDVVTLDDLPLTTQRVLERPLISYYLFCLFILNAPYIGTAESWKKKIGFEDEASIELMKQIVHYYIDWLQELADNTRSFAPFYLDGSNDNFFDFIKGVVTRKQMWTDKIVKLDGYKYINQTLNRLADKVDKGASAHEQFFQLFHRALSLIVDEKYGY